VINRGNYRTNLFEGEGAAEAFERTLGEAAERYAWRVHARVEPDMPLCSSQPGPGGRVAPAEAATYPWSSLPKWPDRKRPAWLCPTTVLSESGGLPDTKAGWRQYGTYLEFLAIDEEMKRELVAKRLSRGWCVGARSFKQEFRKDQAPERR